MTNPVDLVPVAYGVFAEGRLLHTHFSDKVQKEAADFGTLVSGVEHTTDALVTRSSAQAALSEVERERDALRSELVAAREACSLVRRQDYFDVPTPVLIEAQIEYAIWRALTDAAESINERRRVPDGVLERFRARSTSGGSSGA